MGIYHQVKNRISAIKQPCLCRMAPMYLRSSYQPLDCQNKHRGWHGSTDNIMFQKRFALGKSSTDCFSESDHELGTILKHLQAFLNATTRSTILERTLLATMNHSINDSQRSKSTESPMDFTSPFHPCSPKQQPFAQQRPALSARSQTRTP